MISSSSTEHGTQGTQTSNNKIFKKNVKPTDPGRKLKLQIHYKNKKTSHLLLKNSSDTKKEEMQMSHVVYIGSYVTKETVKSCLQPISA
ncbi:hypothetical protein E2C01_078075 [Portunus trituberculatus]|uniref:Uncharacterized protein n=1 Tax=Portunus trituberculatus TaxID=210409 RepID=A0A5B7IP24_PORTR|nr:hypothetical protein [Portunus trituberculatus]